MNAAIFRAFLLLQDAALPRRPDAGTGGARQGCNPAGA